MPGEALEPYAGLFGKLPATGDFVARGLPDAFRARWDAWVTRHLARWEGPWPEGGLRLRLRSGGRTAVALLLPSRDSTGREFPLSGIVVTPTVPSLEGAEAWCAAASPLLVRAAEGEADADALWKDLDALPRPEGAVTGAPPLALWAAGGDPVAADPADPAVALALLS